MSRLGTDVRDWTPRFASLRNEMDDDQGAEHRHRVRTDVGEYRDQRAVGIETNQKESESGDVLFQDIGTICPETAQTAHASTTMHHHSLRSRLRHSATRSGETSTFATGAPDR